VAPPVFKTGLAGIAFAGRFDSFPPPPARSSGSQDSGDTIERWISFWRSKSLLLYGERSRMMLKAVKTRKRQRTQDFMREISPPNPASFASRTSRKGTLDDLSKRTGKVLSTLTPREEIVLRWRFGIGSDAGCTLEEVSRKFSLTPKRVREIQLKAFAKLRKGSGYFD
jgi:DNA-binding CsgD family transcriptional regulator